MCFFFLYTIVESSILAIDVKGGNGEMGKIDMNCCISAEVVDRYLGHLVLILDIFQCWCVFVQLVFHFRS